ncbi:hypothetical protein HDV03_005486 [Kappamyces sp. JEL0829]|nr:hypothetical protein HDV03_005486 [Kappamyces sp. JEL0829]
MRGKCLCSHPQITTAAPRNVPLYLGPGLVSLSAGRVSELVRYAPKKRKTLYSFVPTSADEGYYADARRMAVYIKQQHIRADKLARAASVPVFSPLDGGSIQTEQLKYSEHAPGACKELYSFTLSSATGDIRCLQARTIAARTKSPLQLEQFHQRLQMARQGQRCVFHILAPTIKLYLKKILPPYHMRSTFFQDVAVGMDKLVNDARSAMQSQLQAACLSSTAVDPVQSQCAVTGVPEAKQEHSVPLAPATVQACHKPVLPACDSGADKAPVPRAKKAQTAPQRPLRRSSRAAKTPVPVAASSHGAKRPRRSPRLARAARISYK